MAQAWTWGNVAATGLRRGLTDFVDLCNRRFKLLEVALKLKQSTLGWVNVKDYGATGNGLTADDAAITAAATAAVSGTLYFPPGIYRVSANMTLTDTTTVRMAPGAMFSMDSGVTLTIRGPIAAETMQIFSGSGVVSFSGNERLVYGYPQWWGATGQQADDDTTAVQAALVALPQRTLKLTALARHRITATLNVYGRTTILGEGQQSGFVWEPSSNDDHFMVDDSGSSVDGLVFRNFFLSGSGSATGKRGFTLGSGVTRCVWEYVYFSGLNDHCISWDSVQHMRVSQCRFLSTHNGTDTGTAITTSTYANRVTIEGCRFQDNDRCIRLNDQGSAVHIDGCTFELNGSLATSKTHTIQLDGISGCMVDGCYFEANRTSSTQGVIYLTGGCKGVHVTGCIFTGDYAGTTYSEWFLYTTNLGAETHAEISYCAMREVLSGFVKSNTGAVLTLRGNYYEQSATAVTTIAGLLPLVGTPQHVVFDLPFTAVYDHTGTTAMTWQVDGAAGTKRRMGFATAGSVRWRWQANDTAESGSDAGSDFVLKAYDDSGSEIDAPLTVTRAAGGRATWTRPNVFPAATTAGPSVRMPHGTAPSSPVDGDIWTTTAGAYVRINGVTVGPLGTGGGGGGGSGWSAISAVGL